MNMTDSSSSDGLADHLVDGVPFAVVFGGQGGEYRDRTEALTTTYGTATGLDELWDTAVALTQPVRTEVRRSVADGIGSRPIDDAVDRTPLDDLGLHRTLPEILFTQLAEVRALRVEGLDLDVTAPSVSVGHSQGLLAAHALESGTDDTHALAFAMLLGVAGEATARRKGLTRAAGAAAMVAVAGPSSNTVQAWCDEFNDTAGGDPGDRVVVGVINGPDRVVVTGRPWRIDGFRRWVERRGVTPTTTAGPVGRPARWDDLPTIGAFHHPEFAQAVTLATTWSAACGLELGFDPGQVAAQVIAQPFDWPARAAAVIEAAPEWVIDLGPGRDARRLCAEQFTPHGIGLVSAAPSRGVSELFTPGAAPERPRAFQSYRPEVCLSPTGPRVVTELTRRTGQSPFVLAGMTPTTVEAPIVAAAANAGVWAELAGGGQVTEAILRERLMEVRELLEPGVGIHFNTLFLDPYLWALHFGDGGVVLDEIRRGAPIEGVTVSAGIPDLDDAVELVRSLRDLGLRMVTFKPGTVTGVRQVLDIAGAVSPDPLSIHLEGGRAGGHHSWEDLEDLLLATYAEVREHDNVVLCVGGGIGTPADAARFLDGSWALQHGHPAMPVDGILIGTAAMACAEATTSPQVKQMLARCAGTPEWVGRGAASHGVASGVSQLGADLHELDNAASRCGRLLDQLAGDADAVRSRRAEVVDALDATCKPYFGDLADMTYRDLLERFAGLCAIGRHGRYEDGAWLDTSWRTRFISLLQRTEARLAGPDRGMVPTLFGDPTTVNDPTKALAVLLAAVPAAETTLLHPADAAFFVEVCRRPGKPVPFVPVLDAEVRRWWRSDSLWQAHDDRFDADGVVVIPGPAAVAGIVTVDEPVADLFGRFEREVSALLTRSSGTSPAAPAAAHGGGEPASALLAFATDEPAVVWAGRHRVNPLVLLARDRHWTPDGVDALALVGDGEHDGPVHPTAPRLVVVDDHLELRITIDGPIEEHRVALRLDMSAGPAPRLVVDGRSAAGWTTALMDVAEPTGSTGPDRPGATGVGTTLRWDPSTAAEHAAVFGATVPLPDAVVGPAWPAIFASLRPDAAEPALGEGFMDLVHLDHRVELHGALPAERADVPAAVAVSEILDTPGGRVVEVTTQVGAPDAPLAELVERFMVRSITGNDRFVPLGPPAPGGLDVTPTHRLTIGRRIVDAPGSAVQMALVTGDHNPLHQSHDIAAMAGFGGPIMHGMWLSSAMSTLARDDGRSQPRSIRSWQVQFIAPVRPRDRVDLTAVRTGRCRGATVVEVTATVDRSTVGIGQAVLDAPRTVYAFPGQGIQRPGMGLDAIGRSPAAAAVWQRADEHTRVRLGFSILEVVRDNPTSISTMAGSFRHPDGVLFLTQFTQVAMATLACAQVAELDEADALVADAICCGHSVGEYNALAAISGTLSLEAVVEVVFQRGLAMHRLVPRDEHGASGYRLAAARPSEAGLSEDDFVELVSRVAASSGEFVEVVNFNLRGRQYAVAGSIPGLRALEDALEELRAARGGKGVFVYVPGIDVPFHSSVLRNGVDEFRQRLDEVLPQVIDPDRLVGRYIPNLVPVLFTLDRPFVEEIASTVPSARMDAVLHDWESWAARPQELCREMLLELLAWQFASPVRWIETQDLLLAPSDHGGLGIQEFVEIGLASQPTLATLARHTVGLADFVGEVPGIANVEADRPAIMGLDEDPEEDPDDPGQDAPDAAATPADAASGPTAPVGSTPPPASVDDITWGPGDGVRMLLSWWTKVRPDQLVGTDTVDRLCDGVSSRRNQVLMDLGSEFGLGAIDGAADLALDVLVQEVAARVRGYRAPGPTLRAAIDEQLRKVSGPANTKAAAVKDRTVGHWGLGDGWARVTAARIASGTREGTSVRGGPLAWLEPAAPGSRPEFEALVDAAVHAEAGARGLTVAPPAAQASAALDGAAAAALLDSIVGDDGVLTEMARGLAERLGLLDGAADAGTSQDDEHRAVVVDAVDRELARGWTDLVRPRFSAEATLVIDDRWASQREDLARLAHSAPADTGLRDDLTARLGGGLDVAAVGQARWWLTGLGPDDIDLRHRLEGILAGADDRDAGPMATDVALVTGASPGSIAAAVVARLLAGGATVIATTSTPGTERTAFFRGLYRRHARLGARLWVAPANLASFADVDAVTDWVLQEQRSGGPAPVVLKPALTPTLLFPFAAAPVRGDLLDAGPSSEIDLRVLLLGVERLVARLADARRGIGSADSLHVVLAGSPNRGMFGGDGAYGEAKAALDALVHRSRSESSWGDGVSMAHAIIGWVRDTGLMGGNDSLVDAVEAAGITTFTPDEMAGQLLDLCTPDARRAASSAPLEVDCSGGLLGSALDLAALRNGAVGRDADAFVEDPAPADGGDADDGEGADGAADPDLIPALPGAPGGHPGDAADRTTVPWGAVDVPLSEMVVIVGLGEVGPLGSTRTRREVEVDGRLSAAGVAELAWMCGLVRWEELPTAGFYDVESGDPVGEDELVERYHDRLLAHSGIRVLDDDGPMQDGSVPLLASVFLERDLTFEVDNEADAVEFARADPSRTAVQAKADGSWSVTRRAGTEIRVPRRAELPRQVGAQLPRGFDPAAYGIPADMVATVDRVALWNLVATIDAFTGAGTDPEELLSHVHPALVANTQGTGMGGISAIRAMYVDTLLGKQGQNDILQEALGNVTAAHVMQSYVGGYGSMVHPVAACATAAVSLEEAFDKIRSGRAQFVVAGGFDDFGPEGIVGFANMNATAPSADMAAAGIEPRLMSRPNDRRRSGFVEGQGGGTMLVCRGDLAAEMGLPVRGVLAWVGSFSDGINTSIPAPGVGLVAAGRGGPESALGAGLARLGLGADDIAVISKHDTSTLANDPNESFVHSRLADALGRSAGNPLLVVSQKSVTGHAKGGAAAFQVAGLCQILETGVVPPNRSLDCVDPALAEFSDLTWVTEPLTLRADHPARAGLVTSLGFGHVAALVAIAHPDAFLAALAADQREDYRVRSRRRRVDGARRRLDAACGGAPLYARPGNRIGADGPGRDDQPEQADPHQSDHQEARMLVDPSTRLGPLGRFEPTGP